ncbi:MAG: c-type cytochrome domain-containing protein, partial [Planctomycetaceae bacterium]
MQLRSLASLLLAVSVAGFPACLAVRAGESTEDVRTSNAKSGTIDFRRDVEPIFRARCIECHGPDTQESGFRLDRRSNLLNGGDSGVAAVLPGKGNESRLIELIAGKNPKLVMPPDGKRLSDQEVHRIRTWIDLGAQMPESITGDNASNDSQSTGAKDFWSLIPPKHHPLPAVDHVDAANAIDLFIVAKLHTQDLTLAPQADRRTLIRRLYLDVLGLPPSPDQVSSFASDDRPDA